MRPQKLTVLCVLLAAVLSACGRETAAPHGADPEKQDRTVVTQAEYAAVLREAKTKGLELEPGLYLTDLFAYSGVFPEDGSGKTVTDAAAVTLVNLSPVAYRCVEFTVTCGAATYGFFVSALPVGGRLTAVEKTGARLTQTQAPVAKVQTADPYEGQLSTHPEALRLTCAEGALTVENRSGAAIGTVSVYYKATDANGYLGGLTYRLRIGQLPAGEKRTVDAENLSAEHGKIVFVTVDET